MKRPSGSRSLDPDVPREEVLRLAKKWLEVGKRVVKEGAERVRRYVVNKDVEAEVVLHEQHADIFRRARNELTYLDEADGSDKTIEVTETREHPVINKTTDSVEEAVVYTDGSNRVTQVNETVLRQEVDSSIFMMKEQARKRIPRRADSGGAARILF